MDLVSTLSLLLFSVSKQIQIAKMSRIVEEGKYSILIPPSSSVMTYELKSISFCVSEKFTHWDTINASTYHFQGADLAY